MDTSVGVLTKEDCCAILKRYTNSCDAIYNSHTAKLLTSIEGLIGKHYKLKIFYEENGTEKEINLFLKEVDTPFKVMERMIKSIKAFEKEKFLYDILIKEFKKYRLDVDFAPECYHCRRPIFVLQDLSFDGYKNSPKNEMLDVKHCKVALKTLAKFHASTILYEKEKSDAVENYVNLECQYPEWLGDILFTSEKNSATEWIGCTFKGLSTLIDLLPKDDISAEEFKAKLTEALDAAMHSSETPSKYRKTILHGDLWTNNFMFKYENGVPVNSILIDYQILKYGPIASDVVQMIMTNVRRKIRNVHYEELLSYYFHQFAEVCDRHGFDAHEFISYKNFMESCEEAKLIAKILCTGDHSITFLMGTLAEEAMQTEEGIEEFLFGDRSKSMKVSYEENDTYHEIMTEDLLELRDLLFNK